MSLYQQLFDYQKRIVDTFKDRKSLGLFLDMGLGKTILSLSFAEINKCSKVIVITINAKANEDLMSKGSWLYWASKSSLSYNFQSKTSLIPYKTQTPQLLLINYESLFIRSSFKKEKVQLRQCVIDFINNVEENENVAIIVDESHKMKNLSSMQSSAILKIKKLLIRKTSNLFIYLLSGTPFTTGYIDLYTQLKMLGYNDTKTNFIDQYCIRGNLPGLLGWQQPIVGYKNLDDLYKLIHTYAITIKSEEVIDLPKQIFIEHEIEKSHSFDMFIQEQVSGYEIIKENEKHDLKIENIHDYKTPNKICNPYFRNIDYPNLEWLANTSGAFYLRARELSIGFQGNADISKWFDYSRLNKIKEFLENNPDNYILFYNFTAELLKLYEICESLNYNIDVFCGEIKSLHYYQKYEKMSKEEKLNNKKNIILANFSSGSMGMNRQAYSKVIIASIPFYKDYEQAIKRVHRPGQEEIVFYHIFYQKNWLDYSMLKSLKEAKDYDLKMFLSDLDRINKILLKEEKS